MADADSAAKVDTPADFGEGSAAVARRWISELDLSDKSQAKWIARAKKIALIYREESLSADIRCFSLLWANIQTLAPAVYARTPTATVGRRYKDNDPTGRMASEVLERALNFAVDTTDFAQIMTGLRDEFLLVGRGQAWIRYVPHMAKVAAPANDDAEPVTPTGEITDDTGAYDKVEWEEVIPDHVHWRDFGTNPARNWAEVRYVWRRAYLTREECVARFPQCGKDIPLDWAEKTDGVTQKDDQFAKAAIYEIWDRPSRKAIWISKSYPHAPLDERDDPLGLKDFFPCPRPLLGTCGPDSTIPVPDYVYYQTQAEEINDLTARIDKLTDALKVRGWYAAAQKDAMDNLMSAGDNKLIPVDDWQALQDKGGIDKMIAWMPLEMIVAALKACIETRKQLLDDTFQITGIADIMRGDTDANETAAAQKLKSNWGSSRVRDRQKEMARFARDILRLMGEVIASRFSIDTLSKMTDVKLMTDAEKAQVQHVMQLQQQQAALAAQAQAQQPQAQPGAPQPPPVAPPQPTPIPPEVQTMMGLPSWEDVTKLLQDSALRTFRIEVETDSTIEPNDQEEKQRRVEFVGAVGKFLAESLPVVQAAPQMLPVIMEGLKFLVRGFRVGREMEDVIDKAADALQQAAANPQPAQPSEADQLKAQAAMIGAKAKMQDAQTNAQAAMARTQMEGQAHMAQIQAENARTAAEAQTQAHQQRMDVAGHALAAQGQGHGQMMDAHTLALQTVENANERELRREILDRTPPKASTP
jgi:hypothetical protein